MCNQTQEIYSQCGHIEPFTKTTSGCRAGWDAVLEECRGNNLVVHTIRIDKPPLCPDCFHEKEKELHSIFDEEIEEIEADFAEAEQNAKEEEFRHTFKMKMLQGNRDKSHEQFCDHIVEMARLGKLLALCQDHLKEVYQSKERRLQRFRERQGM